MPQEACCERKEYQWPWERKHGSNPCQWLETDWDEFNASSQYKRRLLQELDDQKELEDSLVDWFLRIRALVHEPEPSELEADIDESGLELRCLRLVPVGEFHPAGEGVQVSRASLEFARRARGLPLVIVGGEEEAE